MSVEDEDQSGDEGLSTSKKVVAGVALGVAVPAAVGVAKKLLGDDGEESGAEGNVRPGGRRSTTAARKTTTARKTGAARKTSGARKTASRKSGTARKTAARKTGSARKTASRKSGTARKTAARKTGS